MTGPSRRPPHVKPPADLPPNPPVPEPRAGEDQPGGSGTDPTRYGDWEIKGVAVDF